MASNTNENFLYLNLENRWPQLRLDGLEIGKDGSLALAHVPNVAAAQALELPVPEPFESPAGIAADRTGNIYISDPARNEIFKYEACTNKIEVITCLAGKPNAWPMFNRPRGLWMGPENLLWVADSGNHRIVAVDATAWQIKRIISHPDSFVATPSAEPGRLNDPWQVVADRAGNFYVVDHGNRRVQKFDRHGRVLPAFWETLSAEAQLESPGELAVISVADETLLFLINQKKFHEDNELLIIDPEGHLRDGGRWPITSPRAGLKIQTSGLAVEAQAVYIGDQAQQRVLKFHWDGKFIGSARHYHGSVAALGFDREGRLLVHPGEAPKLVRMATSEAFLAGGFFLAGPFAPAPRPVQWHRLRVEMETLPEEAHAQFYVYTGNSAAPPPYDPNAENPFADKNWQPLPRNLADAIIPSRPAFSSPPADTPPSPWPRIPARYLWLGAAFQGDETVSPAIHQIRLDYDQENLLRHLPPVYASEAASRDFLERFLSLFASAMERVEDRIEHLPALFDPYAAPPQFLPWLAQWVAMDLEEEWSEQQKRDAIAKAFQLHALRGTVQGLVEYLKLYTSADMHVDEPILWQSLWSLPAKRETAKRNAPAQTASWFLCQPAAPVENDAPQGLEENWTNTNNAILGFTTMLAPAHAQGAVVGTTATLDQSHLIEQGDFGAPLFEDLAHFFYVLLGWNGRRCDDAELEKIRAVIEREKPAHTAYHLCALEPKMRAGFQARVGIDTYVAGEIKEMTLNQQAQLGYDTVMPAFAGRPRREGLLGKDTRAGIKTVIA